MRVLEVLDAQAARRWAMSALSALGERRAEIDALNVFPVPDGDTGTNLYLTLEAAVHAVRALPPDAAAEQLVDAFAHGALLGARGNSGVILAQMVRGWGSVFARRGLLDAEGAREGAARADEQAWQAVADPVEGTVLSVSRAMVEAAEQAGGGLAEVVQAMAAAADKALARTPDQLEDLRNAGVVDAGGRGLVVLLGALEDVVLERSSVRSRRGATQPALPSADLTPRGELAHRGELPGPAGPAYEVMFLLDADREAVTALRGTLGALGESLVVVGGERLWHVHLHGNEPGAVVEAALEAGRPHRIRITHFADHRAWRRSHASGHAAARLVACAAGPGLASLFRQAGAVVVHPEQGRRPSTAEILQAVAQAGSEAVAVLPNDPQTLAVAEVAAAVAREQGVRVTVLPTRAQVQGLAAAAVHDPVREVDDDAVRMSAAAGATRDGAVTVAVREAVTSAGPCRVGDVLGVVQGDFAVVGQDLGTVACEVMDRLLSGGGELVTVVTGRQVPPGLVDRLRAHLRRCHLDVEVQVLDGGQDRYPLLIGVE